MRAIEEFIAQSPLLYLYIRLPNVCSLISFSKLNPFSQIQPLSSVLFRPAVYSAEDGLGHLSIYVYCVPLGG